MKFEELYKLIESEENKNYKVYNRCISLDYYGRLMETPKIFKDSIINGNFITSKYIKTLKNSPKFTFGYFSCGGSSELASLEGGPQYVGDSYFCYSCKLENLIGAPIGPVHVFSCRDNPIKSLEGLPPKIHEFRISKNCPLLEKMSNDEAIKYIKKFSDVKYVVFM